MASTIQIPAEGSAARSAGDRKSQKTSPETSHPKPNTAAEAEGDSQVRSIAQSSPEHHEIAQLAYSFWAERGYEHGFAEEDWLRAERELRESQDVKSKKH